jgi:hypothetical protein
LKKDKAQRHPYWTFDVERSMFNVLKFSSRFNWSLLRQRPGSGGTPETGHRLSAPSLPNLPTLFIN